MTVFGTLIGIFLTSAGIVIGADTVLWGSRAPEPTRGEKTCTPSARSVAAFEGWYGDARDLFKHFHDKCHALARSAKPLSLEEQADRLIQTLQQTYRFIPVLSLSIQTVCRLLSGSISPPWRWWDLMARRRW